MIEYIRHSDLEGEIDLSGVEGYLDLGEEGVRKYLFGEGFSVLYGLTNHMGDFNAFGVDVEFKGSFIVGSNGTTKEHMVYGDTRTELVESVAITLAQSRTALRETLRDSRRKIRFFEKKGISGKSISEEKRRYQKARQEYRELTKIFRDQGRVRDSKAFIEGDYSI